MVVVKNGGGGGGAVLHEIRPWVGWSCKLYTRWVRYTWCQVCTYLRALHGKKWFKCTGLEPPTPTLHASKKSRDADDRAKYQPSVQAVRVRYQPIRTSSRSFRADRMLIGMICSPSLRVGGAYSASSGASFPGLDL